MDYKKEIGRRIAEEMERRAWSLEDLSRATNGLLSKSRVGNYTQGTRMPGPAEVNLLANALGCDAAWLMCLQQQMSKQELDLIRNFRALPERDRNDYQRRIEVLALAYKEPVPDEKLSGWAAKPHKKTSKQAAK